MMLGGLVSLGFTVFGAVQFLHKCWLEMIDYFTTEFKLCIIFNNGKCNYGYIMI